MIHEGTIIPSTPETLDCNTCGWIHLVDIPDNAEMYRSWFYETEKPNYFKEEREDKLWHWMNFDFQWQTATKTPLTPHVKNVLDVGCGSGLFLERAAIRQVNRFGIEPNISAAQLASRHGTIIKKCVNVKKHIDLVRCAFVLEHLPEPVAMLADIRSVMWPLSVAIFIIPNDFVQDTVINGIQTGYYWVHPHHVNYWTKRTFTRLLLNNGFDVLRVAGTYPMEGFLQQGYNYIGNNTLGRECHKKRCEYELGLWRACPQALSKMWFELGEYGQGRDLIFWARKA